MENVGTFEVKTHLSGLLRRVAQGESFTITRNGVPVAKLVPIQEVAKPDVQQAIADLLALRKERAGRGLSPTEIKALVNEGRSL
jgi:prevent-host-death family protein